MTRPNDIPAARCARLTTLGAATGVLAWVAVGWVTSFWIGLLLLPLPLLVLGRYDRRYGEWLAWVARIEGRALWLGIQVSIVTAVLLVVALPLYFVPVVGYFLYAGACGFCTAVSLTDLAFERRQWAFRDRVRFMLANAVPLTAFGIVVGAVFTVPFVGPLAAVPSASVGALWLVCRLDKSSLRPADDRPAVVPAPLPAGHSIEPPG